MKVEVVCDRCGKRDDRQTPYAFRNISFIVVARSVDLCPDCARDVMNYALTRIVRE